MAPFRFLILALFGGVFLSGLYTAVAVYLPILFIGDLLPGLFALCLMWLLYRSIQSRGWSSYITAILGGIANVASLWFVWLWLNWGWADAVWFFQLGPQGILSIILEMAETTSYEIGSGQDVLTGSSGITIGGPILLWFWGAEALFFGLLPIVALLPRPRQTDHHESLASNAGATTARFGQIAVGLGIGLIKGLIPLAIVWGVISLIN